MQEIERKFLIKVLPDLTGIPKQVQERHLIHKDEKIELRIQKKGSKCEIERKEKLSELSRENTLWQITEQEFTALKKAAKGSLVRESYKLQDKPKMTVKVYHGDFEGLQRVEVEFMSEKEATEFKTPGWFGKEITASILGQDGKLLSLEKSKIKQVFAKELK